MTATSRNVGCAGCPGVGDSLSIELALADLDPKPEAGGEVVPELRPSPVSTNKKLSHLNFKERKKIGQCTMIKCKASILLHFFKNFFFNFKYRM